MANLDRMARNHSQGRETLIGTWLYRLITSLEFRKKTVRNFIEHHERQYGLSKEENIAKCFEYIYSYI